jgi:hypothetical protein
MELRADLQPRDETERSSGVASGTTSRARVVCLITALGLTVVLGVSMIPTAGGARPSRPPIAAAPAEPPGPRVAVAEKEASLIQPSAASLPQCVEVEVPYELTIGLNRPSLPCR